LINSQNLLVTKYYTIKLFNKVLAEDGPELQGGAKNPHFREGSGGLLHHQAAMLFATNSPLSVIYREVFLWRHVHSAGPKLLSFDISRPALSPVNGVSEEKKEASTGQQVSSIGSKKKNGL
jgi:hypothetical protein